MKSDSFTTFVSFEKFKIDLLDMEPRLFNENSRPEK